MNKKWYASKTFWSAAIAALLAAPSLVDQIGVFLTPHQRAQAAALAALVAGVGSWFARSGAIAAVKSE